MGAREIRIRQQAFEEVAKEETLANDDGDEFQRSIVLYTENKATIKIFHNL